MAQDKVPLQEGANKVDTSNEKETVEIKAKVKKVETNVKATEATKVVKE